MKKIVLLFALLFMVSTAFVSCRDTTTANDVNDEMNVENSEMEVEVEEDGDVDVEKEGDIEQAVEEGVNEAAENTGLGGNDDL